MTDTITIDGNPADFFDVVQALAIGADYNPDEFDRLLKLAELAKQGKAYAADSLFDITGIQFKATVGA